MHFFFSAPKTVAAQKNGICDTTLGCGKHHKIGETILLARVYKGSYKSPKYQHTIVFCSRECYDSGEQTYSEYEKDYSKE